MGQAREDGGTAFPCQDVWYDSCGNKREMTRYGMTLRDWFAGQAPEMPDQWWHDTKSEHGGGAGSWAEAIASWRYFYADAMLREREKEAE